MGSRGPLPKPAERRVGHHPARAPLELVPARETVPEPPQGLSEQVLELWETYWRSDVARVASEVDLPVVRRYVVLLDQYEKAIEVVNKAIVVKGSTGQIRTNPLADYALKLAGQLLRLEEELGLTPLARQRLGIAVAERFRSLDELNRSLTQTAADEDGNEQDPRLALA
jgi:P27 family predicted phage terminase small subunit